MFMLKSIQDAGEDAVEVNGNRMVPGYQDCGLLEVSRNFLVQSSFHQDRAPLVDPSQRVRPCEEDLPSDLADGNFQQILGQQARLRQKSNEAFKQRNASSASLSRVRRSLQLCISGLPCCRIRRPKTLRRSRKICEGAGP